MKKKIVFLIIMVLVIGTTVFASNTNNLSFTDVDSSYWGYSAINQMVEDGVVNGYEDNTFKPEREITRAEFAKMFSIALGVNFESENLGYYITIDDVDFNHWAYNYIQSAYEYFPNMDDDSVLFEPDKYITREDAAFVLAKRIAPNVNTYGALNNFTDADDISESKRYQVSLAVASGIMNGYGDGTLNPKGNLTRAQVCTLINNIKYKLNLYEDYLKFVEILKCTEITTNLNGDKKNNINAEFIFDVPSIKNVEAYVTTMENKRIDSSITYGRTKNEKYKHMPNINISFYAEPEDDYRIWIYKLTTTDGKTTYNTDSILAYDPDDRLDISYDGEINKDTNFEFEWSVQYGTPSRNIEWHLNDGNIFGTIENGRFSMVEDIIKNVNKKSIGKTLNVMIVAEDDRMNENSLSIYKYNIFGVSTSDSTTTKKNNTTSNTNKSTKEMEENVSEEKISVLEKLGIIAKYTDGTFKPEIIPTNSETVNYVVKLLNYKEEAEENVGKYKKLDAKHWANGYFYVANEKDFFKNLNEDKFASDKSNITCEEFVMLVLNAMRYAPVTLGGANNYWMNAKKVGLFNDMEFASISRDSIITRGFVADILYNALNAPMMERKIVGSTVIYEKTTNSLYEIRFQ